MHKKSLIPVIILGILVAAAILYTIWPLRLLTSTPVTPVAEPQVSGILVSTGFSDRDIATATGLDPSTTQYQLIKYDVGTQSPRHYLLQPLPQSGAAELLASLSLTSSGSCVTVIIKKETPPADNAEYFQSFTILETADIVLSESLTCYQTEAQLFPDTRLIVAPDQTAPITVTSSVFTALRPAYDIGYDYQIKLSWEDAKKLGYGDASGLDHPATEETPIYLQPTSATTAQQLTEAARSGEPVQLTGYFVGGFAESTVFQVHTLTK